MSRVSSTDYVGDGMGGGRHGEGMLRRRRNGNNCNHYCY